MLELDYHVLIYTWTQNWCPSFDIHGPKIEAGVDIHGPKIGVPSLDIHGPTINVPSLDIYGPKIDAGIGFPVLDIHGPKIDAGIDINEPKIGIPSLDIYGPTINVPTLDIHGPNLIKLFQNSNINIWISYLFFIIDKYTLLFFYYNIQIIYIWLYWKWF